LHVTSTIAHCRARDACTHSSGAFAGQHVLLQQSSSFEHEGAGPLMSSSPSSSAWLFLLDEDMPTPGSSVVGNGAGGLAGDASVIATLLEGSVVGAVGRGGAELAHAAAAPAANIITADKRAVTACMTGVGRAVRRLVALVKRSVTPLR